MTSKSVLRREAIQRKDGPTDNEGEKEEKFTCEQIEINGETWVKLSDVQEMMASFRMETSYDDNSNKAIEFEIEDGTGRDSKRTDGSGQEDC